MLHGWKPNGLLMNFRSQFKGPAQQQHGLTAECGRWRRKEQHTQLRSASVMQPLRWQLLLVHRLFGMDGVGY